jgi:hypothetical protein
MGKPRLPWKRGPVAWEIAQRADGIIESLHASRRGFYSLRRAAQLMGVSTQPVRDWVRLGHLKRTGPRQSISRSELERWLNRLAARAEPFDRWNYIDRIELHRKVPRSPWRKLRLAEFQWPGKCDRLTPAELAGLIGCHRTLIIKAIRAGRVSGCRPTPGRWAITRRAWQRAFL